MADLIDIARGTRNTRGLKLVSVFGRNSDVDTGTDPEDVTNVGTALFVAPTQSRLHNIDSSSANDDGTAWASGSGSHHVWIHGISHTGMMVRERVYLNGTANVSTKWQYLHIHKMTAHRELSASLAQNAGNIDATAATDATVTCRITTDMGISHSSVFMVPRGHTAFVTNIYGAVMRNADADVDFYLFVLPYKQFVWQRQRFFPARTTGGGTFNYSGAIEVPELATIKLQSETDADNADVVGGYDVVLRKDRDAYVAVQDIGNPSRQEIQDLSQ